MRWEVKPLGEVCDFQRGLTFSKSDRVDAEGTQVLRATNLSLETGKLTFDDVIQISSDFEIPNERKINGGSVLVCTSSGSRSHLGKACLIESSQNVAFGGFLGMLNPRNGIYGKYLFFNLRGRNYQKFLDSIASGANINNLRWNQLREFEIPIPPLEEQERIVVVLDKAFAAIDKAKANIERNLTNARELFQSRLREIFSNPSEDWKLRKIKEVALIRPPKKLAKSRVGSDELVSVVPMECLGIDKKFFGSEKEGVLENVYSKYVYFEDDDVVIAKITPCFENGKIGVASGLRNGIGFGSSEFIPFRCNEDLCPAFLYHFMNRDSFRNEGSRLMTGAVGHKRIPKDFYEEFSIPIPPLGEQERIVRELDSLDKMKRGLEMKYQTELDNFEEIRQSILEQAFEGKLTKPVAA